MRQKINCLWGCARRYFGKNASAFVLKNDPKIVGCNKCHHQKRIKNE